MYTSGMSGKNIRTVDLENDERVKRLNDLIQKEQDSEKLAALIDELTRLLDEGKDDREK